MERVIPRLRSFSCQTGEISMIRKLMTMLLIGGTLAVAACNTVRGAGKDVESVANTGENVIH
jgi:predicted small secreted protein